MRIGGPWQRLLPGVYMTATGTPTVEQREVAALLYAGPSGVLTGPAALSRHRIRVPETDLVDVLVPAARQRKSEGFACLHRTTRMPEMFCQEGPIRFAMAARAVADTVRGLADLAAARAVTADAVQKGRCKIDLLARELEDGPMNGSALLRRALAEVTGGARSAAEADLLDLIKRARLPAPMCNPRLLSGRTLIAIPDFWWQDAGVAAEVDSREWHASPVDWEHTMRRHEALGAYGIITLHFTPRRIRREPAEVVTAIRSALKAGRDRPPLPIRAVPAAA
ncbi:MAG: hypothetical protein ACM3ML_23625 [Micromonosporaceae bacterium]